MSLLRIYAGPPGQTAGCEWALTGEGCEPASGVNAPADLPRRADRVHLVVPAARVLITRVRLPPASRRRGGQLLAFAVEEKLAGEPEANQVSWLGRIGDEDVLAVTDRLALESWQQTLAAVGIRVDAVHCEMLLLPLRPGAWSLAWNGREGFVRSGQFEGAATDCGERLAPPLGLRLMLDEARARGAAPAALALYPTTPEVAPDLSAWQAALGVELHLAGPWDWRRAPPDAGIGLAQPRRHWQLPGAALDRLRPAAWILAAALLVHGLALGIDWMLISGEQRGLRQEMEAQFRVVFPDAVAVVDPALQMRRKLAEARHAAAVPDGGDFLPMIVQVAQAARELPAGGVRAVTYEAGRMTLKLAAGDAAALQRFETQLLRAGLGVERPAAANRGAATLQLIVRAS